jgi:hypothetical protein
MSDENIKTFCSELYQEILARSETDDHELLREDQFTEIMVEYLVEAGELDDGRICFNKMKGHKVNGYYISEDGDIDLAETAAAIDDVLVIREELQKSSLDKEKIQEKTNRLITFGFKLALWTSERITKFSDATLISAGKVLGPVIGLAGLLPKVLDAIHAVKIFLSHFN